MIKDGQSEERFINFKRNFLPQANAGSASSMQALRNSVRRWKLTHIKNARDPVEKGTYSLSKYIIKIKIHQQVSEYVQRNACP